MAPVQPRGLGLSAAGAAFVTAGLATLITGAAMLSEAGERTVCTQIVNGTRITEGPCETRELPLHPNAVAAVSGGAWQLMFTGMIGVS